MIFRVESFSWGNESLPRFIKKVRPTPTSYLVAELNNKWKIVIDDQLNSDGCASMLYNLNRLYKCEGLNVSYNDLGISFIYYTSKTKRVVNAYCENGKWIFFQKGPLLPFEKSEYYKKKRISERFNKSIYEDYLQVMGLNDISFLLLASKKIFKLTKDNTKL